MATRKTTLLNEGPLRAAHSYIRAYPEKLNANTIEAGLEGLICILHDGKLPERETLIEERAARILNIEYNNNRVYTEADQLFYPSMFPPVYKSRFEAAKDAAERATIYCDWIETFIVLKAAGNLYPSAPCATGKPKQSATELQPQGWWPRLFRALGGKNG